MTVFATPEPTWSAMTAALDEEPGDEGWAFKLAVQCRDHLRRALQQADGGALVPGPAPTEWARDPGRRAPRRAEHAVKTRRTGKDVPGGPSGPGGYFTRWHILLGVLIAHEYEQARQEAPAWTRRLRMHKDWVHPFPQMSDSQVRSATPDWLAARGIYIHKQVIAP
ncbi:hypothetical protein [Kineosporia sp. NBRC 101677]|uniref:hypothetical protein n=1 Tax=Kineosporia sp. NBRC 101677 TaxID=3032197 RepID=UPI002556BF35|nr:hypothetical protein [Kineosporia sp. NBRC 101677]